MLRLKGVESFVAFEGGVDLMNTGSDGVAIGQGKHPTHGVGTGDRSAKPVVPKARGPGLFQGVEATQPYQDHRESAACDPHCGDQGSLTG